MVGDIDHFERFIRSAERRARDCPHPVEHEHIDLRAGVRVCLLCKGTLAHTTWVQTDFGRDANEKRMARDNAQAPSESFIRPTPEDVAEVAESIANLGAEQNGPLPNAE